MGKTVNFIWHAATTLARKHKPAFEPKFIQRNVFKKEPVVDSNVWLLTRTFMPRLIFYTLFFVTSIRICFLFYIE